MHLSKKTEMTWLNVFLNIFILLYLTLQTHIGDPSDCLAFIEDKARVEG
jgi:hypothetical protein